MRKKRKEEKERWEEEKKRGEEQKIQKGGGGGGGSQKWREMGVRWVGYDHRGWVEREIGSRGIRGFEKKI